MGGAGRVAAWQDRFLHVGGHTSRVREICEAQERDYGILVEMAKATSSRGWVCTLR